MSLFKTLDREQTLASRVLGQVESLILQNRLQPGDRFPAERELAAQFGVSRTVVREAVRCLIAKGLLEVKHGSGTIVRSPSAETVSQSMALFLKSSQPELDYKKIMEIRRLLEIEIAGLAAERRTDKDLATMETLLANTAGIHEKRDRFVEWDIAFHSALAAATQNPLFSLLLDSVVATMAKVRELGFHVPGTADRAFQFHRAILNEVRKASPNAAREAMKAHLDESEETMRKALALRSSKANLAARKSRKL